MAHPKTVTDLATSVVGFAIGSLWLTLGALLVVVIPTTLIVQSPGVVGGMLCAAGQAVVVARWLGGVRVRGRSAIAQVLFFTLCAAFAALLSVELLRAAMSAYR